MKFPLNPAQKQAVEHQTGPLLVLAGAGSGKTRVITNRIARLVERGVPPSAIVALTFTNKAAGEMRERIAATIGNAKRSRGKKSDTPSARDLTISTFHSFGLAVLTQERAALGGAFTIFDQGDALGTVKEILRGVRAGKSYDAMAILARISNAKNAFQAPEDLPDSDDPYEELTKIVYPRYQAALRQFRAFDFDDLVCEVARLWSSREDVLARWQARYRFVLVDEYQDTNRAQLEVLRLLAREHRNVCVVGDDDQAIYSWRGADVRNILDFEEHFAGATVVKLEQNYRSCAPVLAVANAVIGKRQDAKYRKTLFTERAGGETVASLVCPTPDVEAKHVARELRRMMRDEGRRARELAVLYRSNGQAKLLEEALREEGVPYRMIGGTQFFERKEVKDLLAYMKLALHPTDEISLRRIVNYPARGIGEASLDKLASYALARDWSLWQAVERVDALDDIPAVARDGCKDLAMIIGETRAEIAAGRQASDVVRAVAERAGLRREVEASSPSGEIATKRWANVEGLFGTFARRDARENVGDLAGFLRSLTLDTSEEEEKADDVVTLSTLHGAKGLEFDVVFLLGCEEGLLPHARTLDTKANDVSTTASPDGTAQFAADIEEERRLFYVGVTRARERLFLSRSKGRVVRGKLVPRTPSRFLLDIPPELLEEREVRDQPSMSVEETSAAADALLAALDALG
jgi:DNA helicase-2/ATP-dependent DNA helicase PcrA